MSPYQRSIKHYDIHHNKFYSYRGSGEAGYIESSM